MNVNKLLKDTLNVTGLAVEQDEYEGKADKYIIFTYADENPSFHANNKPQADTVYIQLQFITPKNFNYFELKDRIRNLLEKADFIVSSIHSFVGDKYQGTEKTRQTVYEISYTQGRTEENNG